MAILKPSRPLAPGDAISVVRPGLAGFFPEWPEIRVRLEAEGFQVRLTGGIPVPGPPGKSPYYAGDRVRASDFAEAFADPASAALMAFRGGSGAIRLLDSLPAPLPRAPGIPIVCGFSDMTYLHAFLARTMSLVSFWGPNIRELEDRETFGLWRAMVGGGTGAGDFLPLGEARVLHPGKAAGRLWGGNLESLAHLSGTPFFPETAGRILFLEDIDEPLYAIDRALRTLSLAGAFREVAGIILGPFSRMERREDDPSPRLFDLVKPLVGAVPVLSSSLPGHVRPMATWPMNVLAELSAPRTGPPSLRLLESPFGPPAG